MAGGFKGSGMGGRPEGVRRFVGACVALAVAWALPAHAQAQSIFGRYHALVIGNNDYREFDKLKTAVGDAEAVAKALGDDYGFAVTLLKNATRDDIIGALDDLRARLKPDDNLLVYYAGHGHLEEVENRGYWLPVDARRSTTAAWIANDDITAKLRSIRAQHVLVVSDSCYSGTLTRAVEIPRVPEARLEWVNRMVKARSRSAFTSGGLEPVVDGGGAGRSVFAAAFLKALADNRESVAPARALADPVAALVALNANQTPRYAEIREAASEGGEFFFVRTRGVAPVPKTEAPAASASAAPPAAAPGPSAEVSFWDTIKAGDDPAAFREYLKQFPGGTFAGLARLKIAEIEKRQQTAAVAPAPRPAQPQPAPAQPAVGTFAPAPGTTLRDCAECPEMVAIPAGEFMMGSPETAREGVPEELAKRERPQHRVRVKAFALGKYEVTRGQYAAFARETGRGDGDGCYVWTGSKWEKEAGKSWRDPGFAQDDRHPAACVNWDDAKAYAAWLSRKTGKPYRLASEAEWEYAARAGTTTARYWGESPSEACGYANVGDQTEKEKNPGWTVHDCRDGYVNTAPVGSFRANPFGLHDMLGNVWEWTEDCWNESYAGAPVDGTAWASGDCFRRVLRGGAWANLPGLVRAAVRFRNMSDYRYDLYGLRVARTLE
jgi:formylglycine-generating enzyme required for sulfatase activity